MLCVRHPPVASSEIHVTEQDTPTNDHTPEGHLPPEEAGGGVEPGHAEAAKAMPSPAVTPPATDDESTVGTGTAMALGCIVGTALLIVFGLIFILVSSLV